MNSDWKEIARTLVQRYRASGWATIDRHGRDASSLPSTLLDKSGEQTLKVEGRNLNERKVRQWLWDSRRHPAMGDENLFIWVVYDDDRNVTEVGLGVMRVREVVTGG